MNTRPGNLAMPIIRTDEVGMPGEIRARTT